MAALTYRLGYGKSTILAKWAKERYSRNKIASKTTNINEFIFEHYVGCSQDSMYVNNMIFRLIVAMQDFFSMRNMETPDRHNEINLRQSLVRHLETAASIRGSQLVIIIDGITDLITEDGIGGLLWVPRIKQSNVRFIFSTMTGGTHTTVHGGAVYAAEESEEEKVLPQNHKCVCKAYIGCKYNKFQMLPIPAWNMDMKGQLLELYASKNNMDMPERNKIRILENRY